MENEARPINGYVTKITYDVAHGRLAVALDLAGVTLDEIAQLIKQGSLVYLTPAQLVLSIGKDAR